MKIPGAGAVSKQAGSETLGALTTFNASIAKNTVIISSHGSKLCQRICSGLSYKEIFSAGTPRLVQVREWVAPVTDPKLSLLEVKAVVFIFLTFTSLKD